MSNNESQAHDEVELPPVSSESNSPIRQVQSGVKMCSVAVQSSDGFIRSTHGGTAEEAAGPSTAGKRFRSRTTSGPPIVHDEDGIGGKRKKRRRRRGRPKRRYKPYLKMSYDEKRALETREERRAENVRRERFQSGIPVAPYNTTQFLLQDRQARTEHEREDVDEILLQLKNNRHHHRTSRNRSESTHTDDGSNTDSSGSSSSTDDDFEDYMEKEFSADYKSAHAERLEQMTKTDLVRDYIEMEQLLEKAQGQLGESKRRAAELQCQLSDLQTEFEDYKGKCACIIPQSSKNDALPSELPNPRPESQPQGKNPDSDASLPSVPVLPDPDTEMASPEPQPCKTESRSEDK